MPRLTKCSCPLHALVATTEQLNTIYRCTKCGSAVSTRVAIGVAQ